MTYIEKTSENELALHSTPEEMAFVLDLINAIEHPIASKLRKLIVPYVRSNNKFRLQIERKIELCEPCKGSGKTNGSDKSGSHNHEKYTCDDCHGEGRRIVITTTRYENISVEQTVE